jgi:copper transporter 1
MFFPRHEGMDHSADTPSTGMSGMEGMDHSMPGMKMYMHGSIGGDLLWFASWQPSGAGATVGVCIGLFLLAILDRYIHALARACTAAWNRGKVGLAFPVAQGDLPSLPSSSTSSAVAVAAMQPDPVRRREAPAAPISSCCASEKPLEPPACDCGCGGECGQSSACGGTGACVPEYSTPNTPPEEKDALAYLPPAVRSSLDPKRPGRWSRPFRLGTDVPRGLLYMLTSTLHFALMLVVMTFQIWWIVSVVVGLGVGEMLFGRFGGERV